MPIIFPKYNLKVPSETTRFRDLGKELREMGASINAALESFDYNGADPNLVLARVAVLEAWRTTAQAQLADLAATQDSHVQTDTTNSVKRMVTQYGIGRIPSVATLSITKTVTFPVAFASVPVMNAHYIGVRATGAWNPAGLADLAPPVTSKPLSPSSTGFQMLILRTDGANMPPGWDAYFTWSATGVLA